MYYQASKLKLETIETMKTFLKFVDGSVQLLYYAYKIVANIYWYIYTNKHAVNMQYILHY